MTLGQRAKQARDAKNLTLLHVCDAVEDLGAGKLDPTTLRRMETGERPGDPKTWGALWRLFGLPLRELYEGLGLPVPTELPEGTVGALLSVVETLPRQGQELVLMYARQAPAILAAVMPLHMEEKSAEESNIVTAMMSRPAPAKSTAERLADRLAAVIALTGDEQAQEEWVAKIEADAEQRARRHGAPDVRPPVPSLPPS